MCAIIAWSGLRDAPAGDPAEGTPLGALFRVSRGQVTGANAVWIAGPETPALPQHFLRPAVTHARELLAAGPRLRRAASLRRIIDLPVDLSVLAPAERAAADRFLAWARARGAADGYVARHRRAWWAVGPYPPAPILCTYMARRPPAFVRNLCGARHINIAHGLYPRRRIAAAALDRIAAWLNANAARFAGRTYAGGLVKFEPREIERIRLPVHLLGAAA